LPNNYYVTFIDDATRKTWVYCIRQKYDDFDTFKKWKALVENETGKSLKCLRSDNRGEYCSKEFDDYCSYHVMRREKTVPRTPQENGVSERMNRTIMERARSIMLRFGYLGKWSPCAYESLSTKGEDFYPHTLLYDSNFTLT
jgi:transposase InsO family protein